MNQRSLFDNQPDPPHAVQVARIEPVDEWEAKLPLAEREVLERVRRRQDEDALDNWSRR